jgi:hypothetical protein
VSEHSGSRAPTQLLQRRQVGAPPSPAVLQRLAEGIPLARSRTRPASFRLLPARAAPAQPREALDFKTAGRGARAGATPPARGGNATGGGPQVAAASALQAQNLRGLGAADGEAPRPRWVVEVVIQEGRNRQVLAHCLSLCDLRLFVMKRILLSFSLCDLRLFVIKRILLAGAEDARVAGPQGAPRPARTALALSRRTPALSWGTRALSQLTRRVLPRRFCA